jgi:3-hydroxyisobutyrate dehydrogenase-like beta-hydroxyacid dehydrogenase
VTEKIALIGLGLMGGTFANHFLELGKVVVGFDPEPQRCEEHAARGGEVASSIGDAVEEVDVALLSLPNSDITKDVCSKIAPTGRPGLLVIDTTTGNPDHALEVAGLLADRSIHYVDATVSGNAVQARVKDIIFMIGGHEDHAVTAAAILEPLGRHVYLVGDVGTGSSTKLIVNHVLSINRAALAEGLAVAEKAQLDLSSVLEVLRDSAAYSKAMDIWGERMMLGDYWPAASRIRQSSKDARLINEHAARLGASRELADAVRTELAEAEIGGLSDADNAAIMEVMRRRAGIGRCEPRSQ